MNVIENIRQTAINYITSLEIERECPEGPPPALVLLPSWNVEEVKIAESQLNDDGVVLVNRSNPLPTYKSIFETYLIKINQMKVRVDLKNNLIYSVSMW